MTTISDEELFAHNEGIKGKVVLITGGGNGIGQAAAVAFAKYGAKIIIGDLDIAGGKHTIREVLRVGGAIGAEATVKECNVTLWEDQVALFAEGHKKYGRIDYVVASAGIGRAKDGPFSLSKSSNAPPVKPLMSVLDVNLIGAMYTTRLAQYYLMKNKASDPSAIVFMGSMAGLNGLSKGEIYSASKHALIGFCRSLCDDMKLWGIRVTVVCPWFIDTGLLPTATRAMLAGLPLTPIERVAGAIFNAATDPDWETSGAAYALPDDGPVLRIERQELAVGIYKILHARVNSLSKLQHGVGHYINVARDLFLLWDLSFVALILPVLAYWLISQYLKK